MEIPTCAEAILNTSLFLLIVPGLVCLGLACVVAVVLPNVVHIAPEQISSARILVIVLGIDMAFSIPLDMFGGGLIVRAALGFVDVGL